MEEFYNEKHAFHTSNTEQNQGMNEHLSEVSSEGFSVENDQFCLFS